LFIDNLLVRIHFIIVMIRWTGQHRLVNPTQEGKGLFINSQTRPLHANEGNQTTRKGNSP